MKERCSAVDTKTTGIEELWSEADSSCSGQPIHLWQFLRELLLKPHNYGRCIRWLNKEKGKIRHLQAFFIIVFQSRLTNMSAKSSGLSGLQSPFVVDKNGQFGRKEQRAFFS
ncbi:hypothetical protein GOODEAATRI_031423 [Goodea atripinnis]|uniref:Uncharacterized protein n=1 Tax=Goodea atripinnis TaxID=208336 RepID=A0ABV0NZ96_9TELE